MKKAVISLISLTVVGLIAYTLYANKEEMKADAKLSEVTSAVIPVKVVSVKKIALEEKVSADGVFIAKTDLALLSETQGKVVRVYKEKGSHVEKGELLAQVENDLIQSEVAAAQANYEKLQSDLERFTKLSENDAVTGRQLEEVKIGLKNAEAQYRSAKKRLENTYIRATASGNINDDFIQEGAFVSPGAKLYEIVDISVLKLNVKVSATEVLRVKEGDEVKITSSVYPDTQFTGKVT
ncbi:MAG TPA: efflux RND transporter periplasmic adaptor subunit, partial [Cryomorphaceae bacterium]|nr:efflux RND transporter periplasmic adaptor subunit [Cryomorphaceae bacterium]